MPSSFPTSVRRAVGVLAASAVMAAGLIALAPAAASAAVPGTPSGLTGAIEPLQPYVGQTVCDPVAKAGLVAFRDLLLRTYPGSGNLGIIRDCGAGGKSEHKEGRAFDWAVSAYNPTQHAQVSALISWLTKTDQYGNRHAMARRLGLMYMIYNRQIWKAYDDRGWLPYSGASPHTDHVHFSFSWAGARKATSYWDRTVAPLDFGPNPPARVTPVATPANLAVLRSYATAIVKIPSSGGAVTALQQGLRLTADGRYGTDTATPLTKFQVDQGLTPTGVAGPAEWRALFPRPTVPFGTMGTIERGPAGTRVTGWAIDADTTSPVTVDVLVDGAIIRRFPADASRPDVARVYPEFGNGHGVDVTIPMAEGTHTVCLRALNAVGTPGANKLLACRSVTVQHNPVGAIDVAAQQLGTVRLTGWAQDPDRAERPIPVLTVGGVTTPVVWTPVTRPDIAQRFPGADAAAGFTTTVALPQGSQALCLSSGNAVGTPGTTGALGCRSVVVRHEPVGVLEAVGQRPTGVVVQGWALDPDTTATVPIALTVDGVAAGTTPTDRTRTDVVAGYPQHDAVRGFLRTLQLTDGAHQVCAVAKDDRTSGGRDLALGCKAVTVRHSPVGALQHGRLAPGKGVVLHGWGLDPDTTASVPVTVRLDGAVVSNAVAALRRDDVAAAWLGYGSAHGFYRSVKPTPGRHTVCVEVPNAAGTPGVTLRLGCRTVMVATPSGGFEAATVSGRTVVARGWGIDPDVASPLAVKVLVDGRQAAVSSASRSRRDVAAAWPGYGAGHGFAVPMTLARGKHSVCVHALNVRGTAGGNRNLGCRSVSVA